jgi:hypothetical protein
MTMRLIAAIAACVLGAVTLAACGGGGSSTSSSTLAGKPATAAAGTASAATPSGGSATARSAPARPSRASSAAASAQFKQALSSFAVCLSQHGVKLPAAGGSRGAPAFSLKGVDTKSASYRRALAACAPVVNAALKAITKARAGPASHPEGHTLGGAGKQSRDAGSAAGGSSGAGGSPGARGSAGIPPVKIPASVTAGMKRFTACMRANGVAGFPEPQGASFNLSGTNLNPHSPQYKAAEARCNPILQAVDSGG